jgi:hypothetical protein
MYGDRQSWRRIPGALPIMAALACFAVAGCADTHPAPDDEGGGLLESPTQEQDSMHQEEDQNR